ncbi:thiol reductant ABC exporter subunit CydD [Gracilibacillus phocaeensis]|uniref:thiol reductant ABC exporter subunit CydD n=1 Tax=Gracilibacillus phocaeensis TaxID=2042304 RepID=UPI001030BD5C|nr:thiol reductant ABC exporter subunit CydD [Gracilibacillus phocaeensis]
MLKAFMTTLRSKLYVMLGLAILLAAAIVVQAFLIVSIIERIFLESVAFSNILTTILLLCIALLLRMTLQYGVKYLGMRMARAAKIDIRQQLLSHFIKQPILEANKGQSGDKTSLFMDTVDEVDNYFSQYMPQMIQSVVITVTILLVILIQNWSSALIILVSAPFIPIFMMIIGFKTKDKSQEQLAALASFSGTFLDTLQGLPSLKLLGRSKAQREKIAESSQQFRAATMDVLKVAFSNSLALEFISMLSIGLIALEIAIRMIIFENLTFSVGFLILLLAPELFNQLKQLGSAFHTGRTSMGAARRLEEVLEQTAEPVEWGNQQLQQDEIPTLRMEQVTFQYGEGAFQLAPIRFTIPSNSHIAIIGKTGAGKSTLLHLLAGLIPASTGTYFINDLEQSAVDKATWFEQISYVSQHPYLLSATVRDNILLGAKETYDDQTIQHIAEQAGIWRWITQLPDGLDTWIGEGGRGLSGGEKQRITLARAFLKKPHIILFDEPTTGLDIQTEQLLQSSMALLRNQATVITVAHRLHTIRSADQILLLEEGYLTAQGTHAELLETSKIYQEMLQAQQGGKP